MKRYRNTAAFFPVERQTQDIDYIPPERTLNRPPAAEPVVNRQLPSFVAPEPKQLPVRAYPVPAQWPQQIDVQATPAQSIAVTSGSHQDRARAFNLVVGRLALAMAFMAAMVAVVGLGVPLIAPLDVAGVSVPMISLAVLAWFGSMYAVVWLAAYVIYAFVSAEGVAWMHTRQGWGYLKREQKHRHQIEKHANGMGKRR